MVGSLPEHLICHQKPVGVRYSSVFVVDLSGVTCLEDLRADNNGTWVYGGSLSESMLLNLMMLTLL